MTENRQVEPEGPQDAPPEDGTELLKRPEGFEADYEDPNDDEPDTVDVLDQTEAMLADDDGSDELSDENGGIL